MTPPIDSSPNDQEGAPLIHPIVSSMQSRELANLQTHKLLSRLLQELDDENTDLDVITTELKKLAIKSGIDFDFWKSEELPHLPKVGSSTYMNFLDQPRKSKQNLFDDDNEQPQKATAKQKENDERVKLLSLLHRERKIKERYEELISSYQDILKFVLSMARKRRAEVYGIPVDMPPKKAPSGEEILKEQEMKPLQIMEITNALKERANAMHKNAEFLKKMKKDKITELDIVKTSLAMEAEELSRELEKDGESSL